MDEKTFRWMLCSDAMASDKLYEGIRNFTKDILKLESLLSSRM
jgi:transaldolase